MRLTLKPNESFARRGSRVVSGFVNRLRFQRVWRRAEADRAPDLTQVGPWFNSQGVELKNLRGQVVVLHFWTFGCINCQRNLPYYNACKKTLPTNR